MSQGGEKNRVLVGLPERLEKSNAALRDAEKTLESLRTLYSQRLTLRDPIVLDQMGEMLGCPKIKGDKIGARAASSVEPQPCIACGTSTDDWDFCYAHDWMGKT